MKVTASFDPKELKALDKDIDDLLFGIAQNLTKVSPHRPIVDKIKQGMKENAMKFENSETWSNTKEAAKSKGIIPHSSPIMTTGQLVDDFKFQKEHVGIRKATSDEYTIGGLTWSDTIRQRPTYEHIINQLAVASEGVKIYENALEATFLKSSDLIKLVMKSPRYPIMDSIMNLYKVDIQLHIEKLIDEAFSKKR
jgi:hypothetical protein